MSSNPENSLGEQPSLVGRADRSDSDTHDKSLSDDKTLAQEQVKADQANSFKDVVELADRYQLERTLGQGGMGRVDLAMDLRLGRKVAIKRIRESTVASSTSIERFLSEAKAIAALSHPNIVQIYDFGWTKEGPYIIMEYVDGGNLQEATQRGAIPLEQAIDVICRLCDGLDKAHDSGIVHRDIKPANILLTKDGIPKLTDFGLAKSELADAGVTMAGVVLGTLDFMPPEQRRDASLVDARSDLWSLAATLYQIASGKSPKVIRLHELNKSLQLVLSKALEELKEDRYQTAKEFRQALGNCLHATSATIELDEGTCPQCGTPNPSHRRFCRECGGSLEATCFSCSSKIAVWEKICDHCGANQRSLLEQQSNTKTELQRHAEQLLGEFDYKAAESVAKQLADISDPRLRSFQQFGEQFLLRIAQQQEQDLTRVTECMEKSRQYSQSHDYRFAIEAIEQIPDRLRDTRFAGGSKTPNEELTNLRSILRKIAGYEKKISKLVQAERIDGLLSQVRSMLELQPHRKDMLELRDKLVDRNSKQNFIRDEALKKAQEHLREQNYEECLNELSRIDQSLIDNRVRELSDQATSLLEKFRKCKQEIVIGSQSQDPDTLLKEIDKCLRLKRNDSYLLQLREALNEKKRQIESKRDAAVRVAKERLASKDYVGCLAMLDEIAEEVRDKNVTSLRQYASQKKKRRDELDQLITESVSKDDENLLSVLLDEYLALGPDEERQLLRMQLDIRRAEQIAMVESILSHVKELRDCADYSAAVIELQSIPKQLRSEEIQNLEKQILVYEKAQQEAIQEVRKALERRTFELASDLELASHYWKLLAANPTIRDDDFAALATRFKARVLETRQQKNKAKVSRRRLVIVLVASILGVILVYIAFVRLFPPVLVVREKITNSGGKRIAADVEITHTEPLQNEERIEKLGQPTASKAVAATSRSGIPLAERVTESELPAEPSGKDRLQSMQSNVQIHNSIGMLFQLIPSGSIMLKEEGKSQPLAIPKPLYVGMHEVTQEQFQKVMGENPSHFVGPNNPVEMVEQEDAEEFCARLSNLPEEKARGRSYRLPTELEWEFACRAGSTTRFHFGDDGSDLREYAWFSENSNETTHPVGKKKPNAFGLYDMHGNVWEFYSSGLKKRPIVETSDSTLSDGTGNLIANPFEEYVAFDALRGGGWTSIEQSCESSHRNWSHPAVASRDVGFRVVLNVTNAQGIEPNASNKNTEIDLDSLERELAEIARSSAITNETSGQLGNVDPPLEKKIRNSIGMDLVRLETKSKPFFIGAYEVTQLQYDKIMKQNPSEFQGWQMPVENVSWEDAVDFCKRLSELPEEKDAGRTYRLPSEAEWEYACRSGSKSTFCFEGNELKLAEYAWFKGNSKGTSHPVGDKKPNRWGLYDMHGNVWEWCLDQYVEDEDLGNSSNVDSSDSLERVIRGGGWDNDAARCSASFRLGLDPAARSSLSGFRVVMRVTEVSN